MALSTGNGSTHANTRGDVEPYYQRLEPIDGGYELTSGGRHAGRVRVFDDRDVTGAVHVQFGAGRGKIAVFHFETAQDYGDLIEALTLAQKQLP